MSERPEISRARIESLKHGVIDYNSRDFTITNIALTNQAMGLSLDMAARTELEVERDMRTIDALLHFMRPEHATWNNEVWKPQELIHGRILDTTRQILGRPPLQLDHSVPLMNRIYGAAGRISERAHRFLRMSINIRGAGHERTTGGFYRHQEATATRIGETAFVNSIVRPIAVQEPPHQAHYIGEFRTDWEEATGFEKRMVRKTYANTYGIVGTGGKYTKRNRADMGSLILLMGGDSIEEFGRPTARLMVKLLEDSTNSVEKAIFKQYNDCVDESLARSGMTRQELR